MKKGAFFSLFIAAFLICLFSPHVQAQCEYVEEFSPEMSIDAILNEQSGGDFFCYPSDNVDDPPGSVICESNISFDPEMSVEEYFSDTSSGESSTQSGGGEYSDAPSCPPPHKCPEGNSKTVHGPKRDIGITGIAAIILKLYQDGQELVKGLKAWAKDKCEKQDKKCETEITKVKMWITITPTQQVRTKCKKQGECVHFNVKKKVKDDGNLFVSASCERAKEFCLDAVMSAIQEATSGDNDPCPTGCSYITTIGPVSVRCWMNLEKTLATAECSAGGKACCDRERVGLAWKGQAHASLTYKCVPKKPKKEPFDCEKGYEEIPEFPEEPEATMMDDDFVGSTIMIK